MFSFVALENHEIVNAGIISLQLQAINRASFEYVTDCMYFALVLKAVEPELDSSRRLLQRDQWERADSSV
jgi:hypothetical protein